jgi:hypothetical protein
MTLFTATRGMIGCLQSGCCFAMESARPLKIPIKAVLINVVGALACGVGVSGLAAADERFAMHTAIAVALIIAGIAMMGYAMVRILLRMRDTSADPKS